MAKRIEKNVGYAPVHPTRRRRAGFGKGDGYEILFLVLWLVSLTFGFCALLWWASTDSSLFGIVFESDTEMRRIVFIMCVSFWAFCSFSLLRFDALAKTREKRDFDAAMKRFHVLDKRHIEREALQLDMSIDKIRSGTPKNDDSEEKKAVVEISSESKGETAKDSVSGKSKGETAKDSVSGEE